MNIPAARIVIDTNVFIAIIAKRSPYRWIFDKIISGEYILCVTHDIVYEYREVLAEKTSTTVADNIAHFLSIHPFVTHHDIYYRFGLIQNDPDDNIFVDCAIAANAECILTNDKHFQELKKGQDKLRGLFLSRMRSVL
jgi:putative PIN family toxin of toxin-antitoxin system